jgi:hypothetical protein
MDFIDKILNFITDSNRRLSSKAAIGILALISVVVIDNVTGFSYYYNKNRQLEQLESIKILLSDSTLTTETRQKLVVLESHVLDRKSIMDYSLSFFKNISLTSSKPSQNTINNNGKIIRNNIWFLLSTSGVYILTTIFVVPVLFITDRKTPFWKLLASMIVFVVVMFFTSWFNYWLFDKIIPDKLWGSWTWNYIINFLLQIGLLIGLYSATTIMNKSNASR